MWGEYYVSITLHWIFFSCLVFQKYTKYSKHDMNKVLDLELKGDIENCLTALGKWLYN